MIHSQRFSWICGRFTCSSSKKAVRGTVSSTNEISSASRNAVVRSSNSTLNSCLSCTMCPAKLPMSATLAARTASMSCCDSSQWSMTSFVTQRRQMASMRRPSPSRSTSPSKRRSRTSATTQSAPRRRNRSA